MRSCTFRNSDELLIKRKYNTIGKGLMNVCSVDEDFYVWTYLFSCCTCLINKQDIAVITFCHVTFCGVICFAV